jgi:hypothetical protein
LGVRSTGHPEGRRAPQDPRIVMVPPGFRPHDPDPAPSYEVI